MSSSSFLAGGGAGRGNRRQNRQFTALGTSVPQPTSLIPTGLNLAPVPDPGPGQNISIANQKIVLQDSNTIPKLTPREKREGIILARQAAAHLPKADIVGLNYCMLNDDQVIAKSGGERGIVITKPDTSRNLNTVNDPRMGPDTNEVCTTCRETFIDCYGHPGRINIPYIINPAAYKLLGWLLKSICWECGRLIIPEEEIKRKNLLSLTGDNRLRAIADESKDRACKASLSSDDKIKCKPVKRKVVSKTLKHKGKICYTVEKNNKKSEQIELPLVVSDDSELSLETILAGIDDHTLELLGYVKPVSPTAYLVSKWLVQPPCVRQPAFVDGIHRDDQFTTQYTKIVRISNDISSIDKNTQNKQYIKLYEQLVRAINALVNGEENNRYANGNFSGVKNRLVGKFGTFRHDLQGSCVGQVMRSVASGVPASDLPHGWVFVPYSYSKILSTPVYVDSNNIDQLTEKLRDGDVKFIVPNSGIMQGQTIKVNEQIMQNQNLRIGDKIFRNMEEGDVVIVNRQPTLHKHGIFGAYAKFWPHKSVGIPHSMVEGPNADFDGDEVNLHVPTEFDAIAEARGIAHVFNCLLSNSTNTAYGVIQDNILGSYLLSDPKNDVDIDTWHDILTMIDGPQTSSLERRAAEFGLPMTVSGKPDRVPAVIVFSALLPEGFYYHKGDVLIINGILVKGRIDKRHIGTGDNTIIKELYINNYEDPSIAFDFITELSKITNRYIQDRGISLGLSDCQILDFDTQMQIEQKIEQATADIEVLNDSLVAANNPYERRRIENMIRSRAQAVSNFGQRMTKENLAKNSNLRLIIESGAKGGWVNAAEISAALGQVTVEGELPNRLAPFFSDDDPAAMARGMVAGSYGGRPVYDTLPDGTRRNTGRIAGINVPAVVFQASAARHGLSNTSVNTQKPGKMSRLMRRQMEDVVSMDDGTVRYGGTKIIQYGNTFNPSRLYKINTGDVQIATFANLDNLIGTINADYGYAPNYNKTSDLKYQKIEPRVSKEQIELMADILADQEF